MLNGSFTGESARLGVAAEGPQPLPANSNIHVRDKR